MTTPTPYLVVGRTAYWLAHNGTLAGAPMSTDGTPNLSWASPVYRTVKNRKQIDVIRRSLLDIAEVSA